MVSVRSALSPRWFPPEPPAGVPGDAGLFGPDSEVWRIGREKLLLASGPAALLLQLAHPLVAAGVAQHSDFRANPLGRLRTTLDITLTVYFGDQAQAEAAAARVRRRHRHVTGQITTTVGRFPAGTPYRADDPQLTRWVHATLVWTAVELYDRCIAPLPPQRRARYQAEMSRFGRLLGVPEELSPPSYSQFEDYVRGMDQDAVLEVGPEARVLAEQVLAPEAGGLPWPLSDTAGRLSRILAAGLLPPRLRTGYGLGWGWREQHTFATFCEISRVAVPVLPTQVRYWPHYLSAEGRLHRPLPPDTVRDCQV